MNTAERKQHLQHTDRTVDAEVAEADRAAAEAANLAAQLETAIASGDDSVTAEQLAAQESLSRFAKLRAAGTRAKAERARAAAAVQARQALSAEIQAEAPELGAKLAELLHTVDDAARAFDDVAKAYSAKVREWQVQLEALDVPRTGRPSGEHEGLGHSAGGDVIAGQVTVDAIDGPQMLNLLFAGSNDPYGRLMPVDSDRRTGAFAKLEGLIAGGAS